MLTIGSTAIKHYFPDFTREPNDLDYIVECAANYKKEKGIEYLENPVILKFQQTGYLKPELLLTLKMSHLFWDINWEKHLFDVQFLLSKGATYNQEILQELTTYWRETKPKVKRSILSMNKENFFNNSINEDSEEHDYLHALLNPTPMFTHLLKDNCEVELDPLKWESLSDDDKKKVVFEETAVMAYERYKTTHYVIAYRKQLKDNIIKHFPQYIALYAILNYRKLENPMFNFKLKIENGLQTA